MFVRGPCGTRNTVQSARSLRASSYIRDGKMYTTGITGTKVTTNQHTLEVLLSRIEDIPEMGDKQIRQFINQIESQSSDIKGQICTRVTDKYKERKEMEKYIDTGIGIGVVGMIILSHGILWPTVGGVCMYYWKMEIRNMTNDKYIAIQNAIINSTTDPIKRD